VDAAAPAEAPADAHAGGLLRPVAHGAAAAGLMVAGPPDTHRYGIVVDERKLT